MFLLFDFYSCNCLVILDYALRPKLSLPACYVFAGRELQFLTVVPNPQSFSGVTFPCITIFTDQCEIDPFIRPVSIGLGIFSHVSFDGW